MALTTILPGLVTGLFAGLFGRLVEDWWFRPKLVIDFISKNDAFTRRVTWKEDSIDVTGLYIRARVQNCGRRIAKSSRVYLIGLEEVHPSGKTTDTEFFDSFILPWPGRHYDSHAYDPRDISPGVAQFVDVVSFSDKKTDNNHGWIMCYKEKFSSLRKLPDYRGTYRFTVLVTGDGARHSQCKIDVTFTGKQEDVRAVCAD